jgi:hypothetical protein
MKAVFVDNYNDESLIRKYDLIITYLPNSSNSNKVNYLFEYDKSNNINGAINFQKLIYGNLFESSFNKLLLKSIEEAFNSNFIENFFKEYSAINQILDQHDIDEIKLLSSNINKTFFKAICDEREIKLKFKKNIISFLSYLPTIIFLLPSFLVILFQLSKVFIYQYKIQRKYGAVPKYPESNLTVVASGRNSDSRLLKKAKHFDNPHWYLTVNKDSKVLESFIKEILSRNESFNFQRISLKNYFTILFKCIFTIIEMYIFSYKKNSSSSMFKGYNIFDFLDYHGIMYFFSVVNYLHVTTAVSFKNNFKHFSTNNLFFNVGTSTSILNMLLKKNGLKTIHIQHGMLIEPFSVKMEVSNNLLYSKLDCIAMDKLCSADVVNTHSYFECEDIKRLNFSPLSKVKDLKIGILSTTLYYSSNPILKNKLDRLDYFHQSFFHECLKEIKNVNKKVTINFKFHPNQKEQKITGLVDNYYTNLQTIIEESHLVITPVSTTILSLIYNKIPFLLYDPKIFLNDSYIDLVNKNMIFYDKKSLIEKINNFNVNNENFLMELDEMNRNFLKYLGKVK